MSGVRAAVALGVRDLRRAWRQPARLAATLGTPLVVLLLLGAGFGRAALPGAELGYAAYLVPGTAALVAVFAASFAGIALIESRDTGVLRAVVLSPAPRWTLAVGPVMAGAIVTAVQGALVLSVAPMMGARPGVLGVLIAAAGLVAIGLGVGGVAQALAWRVSSVAGFHGVMNLVLMPMWLLSGAVFPVDAAGGAIRIITLCNPLGWALAVVRAGLNGTLPPTGMAIGAAAFAVLGVVLAIAAVPRGGR